MNEYTSVGEGNMHKNTEQRENKEVSRWMSHYKQRITYRSVLYGQQL